MSKLQRHHLWPFCIALTIFLVSGTNKLATPDLGFEFSYDKIAHLLVFGLLATTILRIPEVFKKKWLGVWIAICIVSLYGALDEYRQSFTVGRYVELDDWIADTVGAILASVLYFKWHCYRRFLEWSSAKKSEV